MAGENRTPGYISSHSADVILSDIRPIKLKLDALNAINVLLDEFLFSILSSSRSLNTDKLRSGLLAVLPTSLGKEALLEAEVELRAYWDRTNAKGGHVSQEDDTKSFNLQWAYELLRLKCESYSTLNDTDEDNEAETRLQNRMVAAGAVSAPRQSLVAPAALYLTAILESMCEHILSDVGRVASRDSSRTGATSQDLFVALCEDDAIYGLFKTMKVYEQIELLAQAKPRRSQSRSRQEKLSMSRNASQEVTSGRESALSSSHRSRLSSDTTVVATTASNSRSSFERARGMKKLISRQSHDREVESPAPALRRSDSGLSDDPRQANANGAPSQVADAPDYEDEDALQEFDSLMKSGATMKVSLTPDRLKSMEVYKQEKDRRPSPLAGNGEPSSGPSSRANGRRPSPGTVDSITEDDEDSPKVLSNRTHTSHSSVASPNSPKQSTRSRSSSAAAAAAPVMNTARSTNGRAQGGAGPRGGAKGFDADPFPQKTRKIQKNAADMDLDEIMGGSDDEMEEPGVKPSATATATSPSKREPGQGKVSARTRELMDFLNEGPPSSQQTNLSRAGQDMVDFLNSAPPDYGGSGSGSMSPDGGKKGSGRLQRMMSKLSISGSDKPKLEELARSSSRPPTTPTRSGSILQKQTSAGNLSALANRPVPPRYPTRPISPPSSPSEDQHNVNRARAASTSRAAQPPSAWDVKADADQVPAIPSKASMENGFSRSTASGSPSTNGHVTPKANGEVPRNAVQRAVPAQLSPPSTPDKASVEPPRRQTSKGALSSSQGANKKTGLEPARIGISEEDAKDVRRLFATATNADECRVLLDLFLARAGKPVDLPDTEVPYPSPAPSDSAPNSSNTPATLASVITPEDTVLEKSLIELFLGGEVISEAVVAPPKKRKVKRKVSRPQREPSAGPSSSTPVTPIPSSASSVSSPPARSPVSSTVTTPRRSPLPQVPKGVVAHDSPKSNTPVAEVGA